MREHDRPVRLLDHRLCGPSEDGLSHAGVAIGSHHDQIGPRLGSALLDAGSDLFSATRILLKVYMTSVMAQPACDIRTGVFSVAVL